MKIRTLLVTSIFFLFALVAPTKAFAVIQSLEGLTVQNQTFADDSNVKIDSPPGGSIHNIIWNGLLPVSRGGTGASSFTNGSIPFIFNGIFSQDNSNFFWDDINNRLGIGTNSPATTLDVSGNTSISGNLNVTGNITGNITSTNLVPYSGATGNVNLGSHNLTATSITTTSDSIINTLTAGLGGGSVSSNTAFGQNALLNNTTGFYNTAVGQNALSATNTTKNTAVGAGALENSTGEENTAVGGLALRTNTTGELNTALGGEALYYNTTGSGNTALGLKALGNNNGDNNIAIGFYSLLQNTTGNSNIAIGERAGFWQVNGAFLTSPESGIYIGNRTRGLDDNDNNSIVIGHEAEGAGANRAVIGNSQITDVYFGSANSNSNIHGKKLYLGSSSIPGCIIVGDSDGSGVTYLIVNDGVLTASTTAPSACQ